MSLGYFTEAEMSDPEWEFAGMKNANMRWCTSEARFRRRDVRWLPAEDVDGGKCAMVVYTSECLEPRRVKEAFDPRYANALEQDRQELLTMPVADPSGPNCGQKDARLIERAKRR